MYGSQTYQSRHKVTHRRNFKWGRNGERWSLAPIAVAPWAVHGVRGVHLAPCWRDLMQGAAVMPQCGSKALRFRMAPAVCAAVPLSSTVTVAHASPCRNRAVRSLQSRCPPCRASPPPRPAARRATPPGRSCPTRPPTPPCREGRTRFRHRLRNSRENSKALPRVVLRAHGANRAFETSRRREVTRNPRRCHRLAGRGLQPEFRRFRS